MPTFRRYRRRRVFKRRPGVRRRYRRRTFRPSRPIYMRPHLFKYRVANKDLAAGVTTAVSAGSLSFSNAGMVTISTTNAQTTQYFSFGQYFTFSMIQGYVGLADVFDQYQIYKIKYRIVPVSTNSLAEGATNSSNPQAGGFLHWCVDHDDGAAVAATDAAIDTFRQRLSYKWCNIYDRRYMSRTLRPHIAEAAYGAGVFNSYSNKRATWIDTTSPTVQHYGVKGVFEIINPSAQFFFINFKVEATFYFSLKDPI